MRVFASTVITKFSNLLQVLDTFLSLQIKEVSYTDPVAKEEEKKKQGTEKLSRSEKKVSIAQFFRSRSHLPVLPLFVLQFC